MNELPNISQILINTFNSLITQLISFVPKLIGAAVILLIGYLVAKITAFVVKNVLDKIGLDKVGEKLNEIGIVKQLKTEIKLSKIVAKVLYYFILLIFVMAATDTLGVAAITSIVAMLVNFIPRLIAAAIMLQVGVLFADAIKKGVVSLCKSFNVPSAKLIGNIVFFFFLIITIISALGQAGINTTLLESSFNLMIGGVIMAFAVGYGFASRDILANIIASFYGKNRYKEGQIISVDGTKGEIIDLDATTVTLKTEKGTSVLPFQLLQSKEVEIHEK
jgi:small-conductance mechanosensitive channel